MMKRLLRLVGILILTIGMTVQLTSCKETQLEVGVAYMNSECPIDCGSGLAIVGVTLEDKGVVFQCEVEESITGFVNVKDFDNPIFKEALLLAITPSTEDHPEMKLFIDAIKETNTHIVFHFLAKKSGETNEIVIRPSDLQ